MGQTLSNGVYLPNEGERNCYAGLASNWQLLNTAVGNIAEKAPLVHTHGNITNDGKVGTTANLPLITGTGGAVQAGSFGNSANTFCEGNDSRLSDARTPVAHTHGKADITDLLNSNFIPSANNSYDLGSSSYQWNNLYAKKTYTDTVKAGTGSLALQSNGTNNSIAIYNGTAAADGGGFWAYGKDHSNGSDCRIQIYNTSKSRYERVDLVNSQFLPAPSGEIDLGTSTNKWKTLNGVNPGALSLPDLSVSQNVDTTGWVYNGTTLNSVLLNSGDTNVTKNGWLYIRTNNTVAGDRVAVRLKNVTAEDPTTIAGEIGFGHIEIFVPIVAGYQAYVFTNKAPTYIKFYPCLGNVPSGV